MHLMKMLLYFFGHVVRHYLLVLPSHSATSLSAVFQVPRCVFVNDSFSSLFFLSFRISFFLMGGGGRGGVRVLEIRDVIDITETDFF